MKARLLLLLAALPVVASAADMPIAPFHAEYQSLRNGKELARTVIDLRANADGTATLRTSTTGTSPLARMSGLEVTEESTVRWRDGHPESLHYVYDQAVAFKKRHRQGEFDWNAGQASMRTDDETARYALVPNTVERHALTLALAADLARGATAFSYPLAGRKKIETANYADCGAPSIEVPAGRFETRCLERVREQRTARSWYAPAQGWIPVQIEQTEAKGDVITLKLVSFELNASP